MTTLETWNTHCYEKTKCPCKYFMHYWKLEIDSNITLLYS